MKEMGDNIESHISEVELLKKRTFEIVESNIDGSGIVRKLTNNSGDVKEVFTEKEMFTYIYGMTHVFLMIYCAWNSINMFAFYYIDRNDAVFASAVFPFLMFFLALYFLKQNYSTMEKLFIKGMHTNELKLFSVAVRSGALILIYYNLFYFYHEYLEYYFKQDKNFSYIKPFIFILSYYFFKNGIRFRRFNII